MRVYAAGFRRISVLVFLGFAACGGDPSVPSDEGGLSEGGTKGTPGDGGAPNSGEGGTGAIVVPFGGSGGGITPGKCTPKTCDDLDAECGTVADGCGKVLECGDCDDDEVCGLKEANTCTAPDELCVPIDEDEACADKECGFEGDGCGGTYECGTCDDGEACGVEVPFQCSPADGGPTTCQ